MQSRLDEIRGDQNDGVVEESAVALEGHGDIEMGEVSTVGSAGMKAFFDDVEGLKRTIQYVKDRTKGESVFLSSVLWKIGLT